MIFYLGGDEGVGILKSLLLVETNYTSLKHLLKRMECNTYCVSSTYFWNWSCIKGGRVDVLSIVVIQ